MRFCSSKAFNCLNNFSSFLLDKVLLTTGYGGKLSDFYCFVVGICKTLRKNLLHCNPETRFFLLILPVEGCIYHPCCLCLCHLFSSLQQLISLPNMPCSMLSDVWQECGSVKKASYP